VFLEHTAPGMSRYNAHSGPTPRGRGGSEAALAVIDRSGRSRAIEWRCCFPMFGCGLRIEAVCSAEFDVPHFT